MRRSVQVALSPFAARFLDIAAATRENQACEGARLSRRVIREGKNMPSPILRRAGVAGGLLALAVAASAQTLHVDAAAPAGGNGHAWESAYRHLQDALDRAALGGVSTIRVAQGRYTPDLDEDSDGDGQPEHTPGARDESFRLVNGVTLIGGYRGAFDPNGGDPDQRNVVSFATVLSGDLAGDDGPDFAQYDENSLHVLVATLTNNSAVLDGFTIRGGNANAEGNDGGGGLIAGPGSPTIRNCRFVANSAGALGGAARFSGASSPVFEQCDFIANRGAGGGAIGFLGATGGNLGLNACSFQANTASAAMGGGAVRVHNAAITIDACDLSANAAAGPGGAIRFVDATGQIVSSTFAGNTAADGGGALHISGNPASVSTAFSNFSNNQAADGSAVRVGSGATAVFTGCIVALNTASDSGGAFSSSAATLTLIACAINGNSAEVNGGAVKALNSGQLTLSGCSLIGNHAGAFGGGVDVGPLAAATATNCTFRENVAAANSGGGAAVFNGASLTVRRSAFVLNQAASGGGLFLASTASASCRASDCAFIANEAGGFGGGVLANAPNSAVYNCAFYGNRAQTGGGISAGYVAGPALIMNCVFGGNRADVDAQGVGGGANFTGAGLHRMANCTFADNSAAHLGHALHVDSAGLDLANSIVWFHDAPAISAVAPAELSVLYCDVQGGWPGEGNIDADPLFVDRLGPDGLPGTADENLRLLLVDPQVSPAIDAGNSDLRLPDRADVDQDGDTAELTPLDISRWFRTANAPGAPDVGVGDPPVDMGAYEARCQGDLDGDDDVDQADLGILLAAFGCAWPPCPADLNGDGATDQADLGIVLASFGQVCR